MADEYFTPTSQDDERLKRFDVSLLPKISEGGKSIISNIEVCIILLMQRQPRSIAELAGTLATWRQRENVPENSNNQTLRSHFTVKNGMATLTAGQSQLGYLALRKLELVGWLKSK